MTDAAGTGPPRPPARRPSFAVALATVAALAVLLRLAFVAAVDPQVPEIGDASAYRLLAVNLADGAGYVRPFDELLLGVRRPTAEYPPLFPALLAIPSALGAESAEAHRVVLAFVGGGTVILLGLLGRRLGGGRVGLVAAALGAAYPMLILPEVTGMAEALYVPLVVVVLLAAQRAIARPSLPAFAALGAAAGAAALTRAEGLFLGAAVALASGVAARGGVAPARRIALVGTAAAVMVACVAPWTLRNAARLHAFVPVSTNYATLLDGANCDATYAGDQLGQWRETFSSHGDAARDLPQAQACFEGFDVADPAFDEAAAAAHHRDDGLAYARDHAGALPKVMAVRVARTFGVYAPRQQVDFESLEGRPRAWQMAGTVAFWVLAPLAGAGLVLARRRGAAVAPLVATVAVVAAVAAATYGQQRFRVAAEPAVVVGAAVTLVAAGDAAARAGMPGPARPGR